MPKAAPRRNNFMTLFTQTIDRLAAVDANTNCYLEKIDKTLHDFIPQLERFWPEITLYQTNTKATAELASTAGGSKTFYGKPCSIEYIRAVNGGLCYLLVLAGSKSAYRALVREQAKLPPPNQVLPFSAGNNNFAAGDISYLSWHKFVRELSLQHHALMFYAALINDLGKTATIRALSQTIAGTYQKSDDAALKVVLEAIGQPKLRPLLAKHQVTLAGFSGLKPDNQALLKACFSQACTNSEIQQCEATSLQVMALGKDSAAVRQMHFLMEYLGDVPGARLPRQGLAGSLILHTHTLQHIQLLWRNLLQDSVVNDHTPRDFTQRFLNYQIDRLKASGINPAALPELLSVPAVALAVGGTRCAEEKMAKQILAVMQALPKSVLGVLNRERSIGRKAPAFYVLYTVPVLTNPIYKLKNVTHGLFIGLCAYSYLVATARRFVGAVATDREILNVSGTELARCFGNATPEQLTSLYTKLKRGEEFASAASSVLGVSMQPHMDGEVLRIVSLPKPSLRLTQ